MSDEETSEGNGIDRTIVSSIMRRLPDVRAIYRSEAHEAAGAAAAVRIAILIDDAVTQEVLAALRQSLCATLDGDFIVADMNRLDTATKFEVVGGKKLFEADIRQVGYYELSIIREVQESNAWLDHVRGLHEEWDRLPS